jgi:hypothetical protein
LAAGTSQPASGQWNGDLRAGGDVFEGNAASANVKAATETATKRTAFAVPIDVYLNCGDGYGTNEGSD